MFTEWADDDCFSNSPYREQLLGDGRDYNDWNREHQEQFHEMFECFMCFHKSDEVKCVPPRPIPADFWNELKYTVSQIQYIPETIRRRVANCVDHKGESLLGKLIADTYK